MSVIRTVLSAGPDVHSEAGYFKIVLFAAVYRDYLEAVELFLREGSRVGYNHPELGTPLFLACQKCHWRTAQSILDFGADPNIIGPDRM
jgi:ankyrin repeat protein